MSRVLLQPCFVLHGRPYRETSQLLELLSRDHGRLGVIARGSRRAGRGRRPLQPFQPLLLSWTGRGELATVTAAEAAGAPFLLRGAKVAGALYLNELVMRLLHRGDPHPAIHAAYARALADLCAPDSTQAVFRIFEKRLLEALGYALVLDREGGGGAPVSPDRRYHYHLNHGPVVAPGSRPPDPEAGPLVAGRTLIDLAAEDLSSPESLREAKGLMRFVIHAQLDGRPLATRQLFRAAR